MAHIPFDLLPLILEQHPTRQILYSCALVNSAFQSAVIPFLYRTLEARVARVDVYHPSTTVLQGMNRKRLAHHVRHVTETGAVHGTMGGYYPYITDNALEALKLYVNLESFTWTDDCFTSADLLSSFIAAIQECNLPIRTLNIRTYSDIGAKVWQQLRDMKGLQKLSIWCMEGPPPQVEGWARELGESLTHLEIGINDHSSRCPTFLSQLPKLRELRVKGASSAEIPLLLSKLPTLAALDTEYISPRMGQLNVAYRHTPHNSSLQHLTVRTSSMDTIGAQSVWHWIQSLVPGPCASLESFVLHAFTVQGQLRIARSFILNLAEVHGACLRKFAAGTTLATMDDIECICTMFPLLEELVCCIDFLEPEKLVEVTANAKRLQKMRINVKPTIAADNANRHDAAQATCFTLQHATQLMMHPESQLCVIEVGGQVYQGHRMHRWDTDNVYPSGKLLGVVRATTRDPWV
ncbi:hypothetical protein PLICRDRAFT_48541 [Plicaturopsis crispa FD-325 SS-3]|nr:hypothetical protein PLICRDRAFT_48541 [Plicaturopsis crispa FD-325 SS-3]